MKRTADWPAMFAGSSKDGKTPGEWGGDNAGSQPKSWPAVRRQPCPAEGVQTQSKQLEIFELHAFSSEGWWTVEGARMKARRLQRAGLPDFKNWRFVTLTMEQREMSPLAAYNLCKARLRRFLSRFRKAIGRKFLWCWKLEFHDDGFAHWHLLIEYTKRFPEAVLAKLNSWWKLGRVNVRRVNGRDIRYVFKYVAKGPEDVPEWVSKYRGSLRVFQACQGFYTRRKTRVAKKVEPRSCVVRMDLFARISWDRRRALLIRTDHNGERRVRVVKLRMTFSALLLMRAYESIQKRVQLAPPGVVNISQYQAQELQNEHRKFAGLAGIPFNAAFAA